MREGERERLLVELEALRRRVGELEASQARGPSPRPFASGEATIQSVFRAAPIGIGLTLSRVLLEVNERLCEMVGCGAEELVGKSARVLYPSDADFDFVGREKYAQIARRGTGTVETRFLRKDGRVIDVLLSSTPLEPSDPESPVTFTALDITDRKAAEAAVRAGEERLRALVESTNDWIWEVDAGWRYTYSSPAVRDILGYEPDAVLGKRVFDLMSHAEARRVEDACRQLAASGAPLRMLRNVNIHKDGRQVVLETSGVPILDPSGALVGYRGIDRDVSEQVELEAQLRQSQKMEAVGLLAGGVAHDFRNLLHAIQGYAELAAVSLEEGHPARAELAEVALAVERAVTLVRQLLTFSRREAIRPEALDLEVVVGELVRLLRRVIGEHVELVVRSAGDLPRVSADRGQVEQVLMNLCVNARDAMPRGGCVTIEIERAALDEAFCRAYTWVEPGEFVVLSVSDEGEGVPVSVRDRIFEPFFTTKDRGRGTGLGLATTYAILRSHGGLIEVADGPHGGAVFRAYFPAREGPVTMRDRPAPGELPRGGGERVLVAEDDELVRNLTAAMLTRAGFEVVTASDGAEAVGIFVADPDAVDLVVCDVVMPRLGGRGVFDNLRALRPELPVLFTTGYDDSGMAHERLPEDHTRILRKPFEPWELVKAIHELLVRP